MKPTHTIFAISALFAALALPACAQHDHADMTSQAASTSSAATVTTTTGTTQPVQVAQATTSTPSPAPAAQGGDYTAAEVRKIDTEQGAITLKHEEIKSLDMPGMTMVFRVKDKAMLDAVKAGDKVRFKAAKENGKYMVTEIQTIK